jgi:hypothetical protein
MGSSKAAEGRSIWRAEEQECKHMLAWIAQGGGVEEEKGVGVGEGKGLENEGEVERMRSRRTKWTGLDRIGRDATQPPLIRPPLRQPNQGRGTTGESPT